MKLNSDNRDLMPVTDAVYGTPPKAPKPKRDAQGNIVLPKKAPERPLWRVLDQDVLNRLRSVIR